MHEDLHNASTVNPETHHEESDVNVRAFLWSVAIFIAFAILTHLSMWVLFRFFRDQERRNVRQPMSAIAKMPGASVPEEPRLQPFPNMDSKTARPYPPNTNTPVTDMEDMRRSEDQILHNYSWADQQTGRVRLPIDVAMKLAVQRGFPVQGQPQAAAPVPGPTEGESNAAQIGTRTPAKGKRP
jgi:hypothetical protein